MSLTPLTSLTPKKSDLYSDLCSDLYSDLSQKEVTIGKPHKHWVERGVSDLCEVFYKK